MAEEKKDGKILGAIAIGIGGAIAGKMIKDAVGKNYISSFLRACSDFEKQSKNVLKKNGVNLYLIKSFSDNIASLKGHKLISSEDAEELDVIRKMRNKVVHGNQEALNKTTAEAYSRKLKQIIQKLN